MIDVIIVGAGMAGLTSGIYLARAGVKVLVLESSAVGGQILPAVTVENWPGDLGVSGAKLMEKIYHQANKLGVEVRYETVTNVTGPAVASSLTLAGARAGVPQATSPVTPVNCFTIETDETKYSCGAIIIATGTEPRKLSKKQMESAGERPVSYCATCDGALYKDKPVVVIGSGNTAKHEIRYLEEICSKVYHIHHDDPIPAEAEAVFVATKRVPATGVFADLVELDKDGYVVAGEDCVTSCPGVFVAGDCRTKSVRQLVTAAGDGAVASADILAFLSERKARKET